MEFRILEYLDENAITLEIPELHVKKTKVVLRHMSFDLGVSSPTRKSSNNELINSSSLKEMPSFMSRRLKRGLTAQLGEFDEL